MYTIKTTEATNLLSNFRKFDVEGGISTAEDSTISESLFLIKALEDTIELYKEALKKEAVTRNLNVVDEKRELKLVIEDGKSSTKIDADKVFKSLPYDQFIALVNVVQSKATTKEQKEAIEVNSVKLLSESKTVAIRKLSKADLQKLKS